MSVGKAYGVGSEIAERVAQVWEVHSISGNYDLMLTCYLDDDVDIGHFVTQEIQTLADIQDTFTINAFKAIS